MPLHVLEGAPSAGLRHAATGTGEETDTLTFRLRNLTARTVSLTFGSSCQVLPYIEDVNDGVVYPHGGFFCLTVITTLTLPAFGETTMIQPFRGDTVHTPGSGTVLAPGSYRAYAALDQNSEHAELRSNAVAFTIQ